LARRGGLGQKSVGRGGGRGVKTRLKVSGGGAKKRAKKDAKWKGAEFSEVSLSGKV